MCIEFSNIKVFNLENAIRGMRNPLKSWDKSDSEWIPYEESSFKKTVAQPNFNQFGEVFELGENDLELAMKLTKAGSDHRKFLRQILVSMDVTAPAYWFRQFDTYKVGTTANSTSQMHTASNRLFTKDDFEYIDDLTLQRINKLVKIYQNTKSKDIKRKLIQIMPTSYLYTRTITLNYEVLRNQYHSRKNHFLDEWKKYCKFLHHFPYSEFITESEKKEYKITMDKVNINEETYKELCKKYYKEE